MPRSIEMKSESHVGAFFDWMFRDRRTGRIVIAQFPNLPLWCFIAAEVVRWILAPAGAAGAWLGAISAAALAWWAVDEIARGVNPFRRFLGLVVAVLLVAALISRV
ncbi:MAG TPA: hypothetical protein VGP92_15555 [Acidimicrobiia bacterium]|nr:hypothetical protein [Acidimicrobiia bacterium]